MVSILGAVLMMRLTKQNIYPATKEKNMTSVLFSGGLNYQRNNPLQSEIRSLRRELDDIRGLIKDIHVRLDKADIAPLPESETIAYQASRAAEQAAFIAAQQQQQSMSFASRSAPQNSRR